MYANGRGVPRDDVMAYALFNVAAASGHEEARNNRDRVLKELSSSQIQKGQSLATEIFDRIQKRK
jgi:hypothetical protein